MDSAFCDFAQDDGEGFSCLTLVTYMPIRVSAHRMAVRFELESIEEDTEAGAWKNPRLAAGIEKAIPVGVPCVAVRAHLACRTAR